MNSTNLITFDLDVVILTITSSTLSIVGGIVILATYVGLPGIRNFTRKMLLSLTVADLLTASGYLISATHYLINNFKMNFSICLVQGTVTTYSCLVSFSLISVIAIYLYDTVTHRRGRLGTGYWLLVFNIISWGAPATIIGVGLSRQVFGVDETLTGATGPWCWVMIDRNSSSIADKKNIKFWMTLSGKGWEIACYIITTCLYLGLRIHLKNRQKNIKFHEIHMCLRDEDQNFIFVPVVLILTRFWGIVRFLYYVIGHPWGQNFSNGFLLRMQAFGDPSQAFYNFVIFCLFDKTIRMKICSYLGKCKRTERRTNHSAQEVLLRPRKNNAHAIIQTLNGKEYTMASANSEGSDQTAHPLTLIRAFAVRKHNSWTL